MEKKALIFLLLLTYNFLLGQIGIGTVEPNQSSILDIVSTDKGILVPRISDPSSILNPAEGLMVFDTTKKCFSQNVGTSSSPNWVCISENIVKFFYMPSIAIPTTTTLTGQTIDLYNLYRNQFETPQISSVGAPASIPFFPNSTDLYYYITDYDTSVFSNVSISNEGILTYDVSAAATDCSLMNIVFVIK